jgi:hypothetical protein
VAGKQQATVEMLAQKRAEADAMTEGLASKDARYTADTFDFDRHIREKEEELREAREQAPMVSTWHTLYRCDTPWHPHLKPMASLLTGTSPRKKKNCARRENKRQW